MSQPHVRISHAKQKLCLITGVGPGTGSALVKVFIAAGYQVAMIARNAARLKQLETELDNCFGFSCDVGDAQQLLDALAAIKERLGHPEVVVHNAVGGAFGDFLTVEPEVLNTNFQINTMALLHLGQALTPDMIQRGSGVIICTGNTSAYRGRADFAGFAPTKAAQRILAESMARLLGPQGIHVAYVAIDAVISVPWTRAYFKDKPHDFFCQPEDIAAECLRIAHQPKSAWSFNVELRPFAESW